MFRSSLSCLFLPGGLCCEAFFFFFSPFCLSEILFIRVPSSLSLSLSLCQLMMLTLLRFSLSVRRPLSFLHHFCPPLFTSHLRLSLFLISFPSQLKRFKFVFGEILSARLPCLICYIWRPRRALRGLQSCLLQESPTC